MKKIKMNWDVHGVYTIKQIKRRKVKFTGPGLYIYKNKVILITPVSGTKENFWNTFWETCTKAKFEFFQWNCSIEQTSFYMPMPPIRIDTRD